MGQSLGQTVKFTLMALALWHIDWRKMARRAVIQSEGDVLTEEELEEDVLLRSELVLPPPTMAGTTPVLAILSTPPRVHHHHHHVVVGDSGAKRNIRRSNSYGSVSALHNINREQ